MARKSYLPHIAVLLGFSAALLLFAYLLVAHHRAVPERALAITNAVAPGN